MNPVDILREEREEMPAWLTDFSPLIIGDRAAARTF